MTEAEVALEKELLACLQRSRSGAQRIRVGGSGVVERKHGNRTAHTQGYVVVAEVVDNDRADPNPGHSRLLSSFNSAKSSTRFPAVVPFPWFHPLGSTFRSHVSAVSPGQITEARIRFILETAGTGGPSVIGLSQNSHRVLKSLTGIVSP